MDNLTKSLQEVQTKLNNVSNSFCLAKWSQVTIHLGTGLTHSCHHPIPHKVPINEIKKNPSALHNTSFKKKVRKLMLEGRRHHECHYCWDVEDAEGEHFSDRIIKSSQTWTLPDLEDIAESDWQDDYTPPYVEISFGSECNFSCSYCYPQVSSSIWADLVKNGPYFPHGNDANKYEQIGLKPYSLNEPNPYVDTFWKWWPELSSKLKVFRITGGEPLINPNTFKTLDYISENPLPNLELSINSNFGVPAKNYQKFITKIKELITNKKIKSFICFTSVDAHGKQAEYIRHGLNYELFWQNVRTYLAELSGTSLNIMCTYNVLSVPSFNLFLEDIVKTRKDFYGTEPDETKRAKLVVDINYLRWPEYMCIKILDRKTIELIKSQVDYMDENNHHKSIYGFNTWEINKLKALWHWIKSTHPPEKEVSKARSLFYQFFKEYDRRKEKSFLDTFPEMKEFYHLCEIAYDENR
jgi:organic radical activating enzyme